MGIKSKKLVFGVGVNDAKYSTQTRDGGSSIVCPFYSRWKHMLERAYSANFKKKNRTYDGCTVDKKWHTFSNFKNWMENQDWEGKELDKDLLYTNNKIYSSKTCTFVSPEINLLLTTSDAARGELQLVVDYIRESGKYRARIKKNGKQKHLGLFLSKKDAHVAYLNAKISHLCSIMNLMSNDGHRVGLGRHIGVYEKELLDAKATKC